MKNIFSTKHRPVRDIILTGKQKVDEIVAEMRKSGGFVGRHLAEGVEILETMTSDRSCVNFLSFPAAPVATGLRGVLKELVKRRFVDVIITSSGTLDHDLARSWSEYYEGSFTLDDSDLSKRGFHRLGNIIIPRESYGPLLESRSQPFLRQLYEKGVKELSSVELTARLGEWVGNESSLLFWAWKNKVPIIIQGLMDGAVGNQIWLFSQMYRDFRIDILKDEQILSDIIYSAKKTGALIIGGGITKHHTLWWNQFRGGLDYAVFITTAVEYDGSLSGAEIREAVSWGKVKAKALHVTVHGDATTLLPFMASALLERTPIGRR